MPTGYTSDIAKGISFKTFALHCARAFGALSDLKDQGTDVPIPDECEPNWYYKGCLDQEKQGLKDLQSLSMSKLETRAADDYDKGYAYYTQKVQENQDLREKYDSMLRQVRAWRPPTPEHQGLKKFMIEQIEISIQGDLYPIQPPVQLSPESWRKTQVKKLEKDIQFYEERYDAELRRAEKSNRWVKALKDSL